MEERAMRSVGVCRPGPELKQIVAEASRALAILDADRLEELARACQALVGNHGDPAARIHRRDLGEAAGEMAVFGRVLDATRANLKVMRRLRELRQGRFADADPGLPPSLSASPENRYGHD